MKETEALRAQARVNFEQADSVLISLFANEPLTKPRYRLYFKPSDPLNDRCVTLGFVIAALLDNPESVAPSSPSEEVPPPDGLKDPDATASDKDAAAAIAGSARQTRADATTAENTESESSAGPALGRADVLLLTGGIHGMVALDSGVPQFGPELQVNYQPTRLPLQAVVLGAWGLSPEQTPSTELQFYFLEAGLAYNFQLPRSRFAVAPSARLALEHFFAKAASDSGATEQLSRTMLGLSLGVAVSYRWGRHGRFVLGTDVLKFDGGTRIEVEGTPLGSVPAVNFRGFIGVSYGFL